MLRKETLNCAITHRPRVYIFDEIVLSYSPVYRTTEEQPNISIILKVSDKYYMGNKTAFYSSNICTRSEKAVCLLENLHV